MKKKSTVLFLFVTLLSYITVTHGRETCRVSAKKSEMKCANISSHFLPSELILQYDEDFYGLSIDITKLEIVQSNITVVQRNSFKHTISLVQLIISSSSVMEIESGALKNLRNLKWLDLSFNSIKTIAADSFIGVPLKHLKLEGNTEFEVPTNGPMFDAPKLTWLNLKNCGITHLSGSGFQQMPLLSHLDLSYNNLAMLPAEVFVPLQSLIYLDLSYNNFQTLNFDVFKSMPSYPDFPKNLILYGNKWHCDCRIAELIKWATSDVKKSSWLMSPSAPRIRHPVYCHSPDQYYNTSWSALHALVITC